MAGRDPRDHPPELVPSYAYRGVLPDRLVILVLGVLLSAAPGYLLLMGVLLARAGLLD